VFIKPTVDNTFVIRIDRAKDARKDLEGKLIPNPELDPETPGTKVIECNLTKVLCGDLNLICHPKCFFVFSL